MKGLKRKLKRGFSGFLSLCVFLTSFNMVSWAEITDTLSSQKVTFVMSGEELQEAAQEAVNSGETITFEDLGIEDGDEGLQAQYERLFADGFVYKFDPPYEIAEEENGEEVAAGELRMFICVPEDSEDYELTGAEKVIFLYLNQSEAPITFRSNVDGYLTKKVEVESYGAEFKGAELEKKLPEENANIGGSKGVENESTSAPAETVEETKGNVQEPSAEETKDNVQEPTIEETEDNAQKPSGEETEETSGEEKAEEPTEINDSDSHIRESDTSNESAKEEEQKDNG